MPVDIKKAEQYSFEIKISLNHSLQSLTHRYIARDIDFCLSDIYLDRCTKVCRSDISYYTIKYISIDIQKIISVMSQTIQNISRSSKESMSQ